MTGFILDYRKELGSNIWMMPPLYHRTWQYIKYMANHKDNTIPMRDGQVFTIKRGSHLTSIRQIAQGVGWYEGKKWKEPNPKTIKNILDWLQKQDMIIIDNGKGNSQYTHITVANYSLYQSENSQGNARETPEKQLGNSKVTSEKQSADINNNDNNDNNDITMINNDNNDKEEWSKLINKFNNNIHLITGVINEKMQDWTSQLSIELVSAAIDKAVLQNVRKWSYIEGILKNWQAQGYKTLLDIENGERSSNAKDKQYNGQANEFKETIGIEIG